MYGLPTVHGILNTYLVIAAFWHILVTCYLELAEYAYLILSNHSRFYLWDGRGAEFCLKY